VVSTAGATGGAAFFIGARLGLALATVSTAGATGGAAFFIGGRLGLALATARFAAAFPRAAFDSFLLLGRAFAPFLFWTFDDCFLRLAMIDPWLALGITKDKPPSRGNTS
jgi:hypothetical protein